MRPNNFIAVIIVFTRFLGEAKNTFGAAVPDPCGDKASKIRYFFWAFVYERER